MRASQTDRANYKMPRPLSSVSRRDTFHNLKAWFSDSAPEKAKVSWKNNGGREVSAVTSANFIFTSDASYKDTLKIYESEEFLQGLLAVFHTSYIDACLEQGSAHQVAAADFVVLPPDMAHDIERLAFVSRNTIPEPTSVATQEATTSRQHQAEQEKRSSTEASHCCSQTGGFVGGLEVQATDIPYDISNLESIPHVSTLFRVEGDLVDCVPGVQGFSVSLKA